MQHSVENYIFTLNRNRVENERRYPLAAGPKPVIEQSFRDGYIFDGKGWMRMHQSQNLATHTYDEETAVEIIKGIRNEYFFLLKDLKSKLEKEKNSYQNSLLDE